MNIFKNKHILIYQIYSTNIFNIQPVFTEVVVGGHAEMVNCCLVVCRTNILQNLSKIENKK